MNIVRGTHGQLIAFLVLNAWPAHFGLPVLLAIVFFSKKIYRHITFINLCVVFIIIGMWVSWHLVDKPSFTLSLVLPVYCGSFVHIVQPFNWTQSVSTMEVLKDQNPRGCFVCGRLHSSTVCRACESLTYTISTNHLHGRSSSTAVLMLVLYVGSTLYCINN